MSTKKLPNYLFAVGLTPDGKSVIDGVCKRFLFRGYIYARTYTNSKEK